MQVTSTSLWTTVIWTTLPWTHLAMSLVQSTWDDGSNKPSTSGKKGWYSLWNVFRFQVLSVYLSDPFRTTYRKGDQTCVLLLFSSCVFLTVLQLLFRHSHVCWGHTGSFGLLTGFARRRCFAGVNVCSLPLLPLCCSLVFIGAAQTTAFQWKPTAALILDPLVTHSTTPNWWFRRHIIQTWNSSSCGNTHGWWKKILHHLGCFWNPVVNNRGELPTSTG